MQPERGHHVGVYIDEMVSEETHDEGLAKCTYLPGCGGPLCVAAGGASGRPLGRHSGTRDKEAERLGLGSEKLHSANTVGHVFIRALAHAGSGWGRASPTLQVWEFLVVHTVGVFVWLMFGEVEATELVFASC